MCCDLALVTMSDFKHVESESFTYPELVAKFGEELVQSEITEGVIIPSGSLDVIESDDHGPHVSRCCQFETSNLQTTNSMQGANCWIQDRCLERC